MKKDLRIAEYILKRTKNGYEFVGNLYLRNIQITKLPDNLTIDGSMFLSGTQITNLPNNLTVNGYLDLEGTQIIKLPNNLNVGLSLDLRGTQITELPEDLNVRGNLYLNEGLIFYKGKEYKVLIIDKISFLVLHTSSKMGFEISKCIECRISNGEIVGEKLFIISKDGINVYGETLKKAIENFEFITTYTKV